MKMAARGEGSLLFKVLPGSVKVRPCPCDTLSIRVC